MKRYGVFKMWDWEQRVDVMKIGLFAGWGNDFVEFNSGPANHTAAIIEMPDGTVKLVYPLWLLLVEGK